MSTQPLVVDRGRPPAGVGMWVAVLLLVAAVIRCWLAPLLRPPAPELFLGGHYRLSELALGVPLAAAALVTAVSLLTPSRVRRPVALRLTTVALAVLIAVPAFDALYVGARLSNSPPYYWFDHAGVPRDLNLPDPELGFIRKPNLSWRGKPTRWAHEINYRTDADGFRNPPGVTRADIVFLGDSFTEGQGVPDESSFPVRVGAATGLRIANLGRCSHGPQQELRLLQRFGLRYQPRLVVWQLFEGNDLGDAERFAAWRARPDNAPVPLKYRYFNESPICRLLVRTMPPDVDATVDLGDGTTAPLIHMPSYYPNVAVEQPRGLAETRRALRTGLEECRKHGIRMIVLFIPSVTSTLHNYLTFLKPAAGGTDFDSHGDFRSAMRHYCRELGCTFVDALGPLRERARRGRRGLFFWGSDMHLDLDGHEVVAAALSDAIRRIDAPAQR